MRIPVVKDPWFRRREKPHGWRPVCWQGWATFLGFIVAVILVVKFLLWYPVPLMVGIAGAIALLFGICYLTGDSSEEKNT